MLPQWIMFILALCLVNTGLAFKAFHKFHPKSSLRYETATKSFLDKSSVNILPISQVSTSPCVMKVVGVGGGGGNAVMRMIDTGVEGVDFVAINTDVQALSRFNGKAATLTIGKDVTRGLGAGGVPDNGRKAAEESRAEIFKMVEGCDLVFVTAGMGGGTGSGAAPIVAEIAKEAGALTVGVVTKPFAFEGKRRMQQALQSIENLRAVVDTLIIVSNDRLLRIIPEGTPVQNAFMLADEVLRQGVVGISEIISRPGLINVDFADVKAIMGDAGTALMGIGQSSGKNRAQEAALEAISSPLLDFPIEKARGVVFNIVGGTDMTLQEINAAADVIYKAVDPGANIIFGALVDESMANQIAITVIATGFPITTTSSDSDLMDASLFEQNSGIGSVRVPSGDLGVVSNVRSSPRSNIGVIDSHSQFDRSRGNMNYDQLDNSMYNSAKSNKNEMTITTLPRSRDKRDWTNSKMYRNDGVYRKQQDYGERSVLLKMFQSTVVPLFCVAFFVFMTC